MIERMVWVAWFLFNVVQAVFTGTWTALWITLAGIASIFDGELPLVMARRIWGPGLIWAAGGRVVIEGGDSLDPNASYVFLMNHQSMIDIPVAFAVLPKNLRFVAKSVLKYVPFLGFYMWRTGMVFVDRNNPAQAYSSLAAG